MAGLSDASPPLDLHSNPMMNGDVSFLFLCSLRRQTTHNVTVVHSPEVGNLFHLAKLSVLAVFRTVADLDQQNSEELLQAPIFQAQVLNLRILHLQEESPFPLKIDLVLGLGVCLVSQAHCSREREKPVGP